MYTYLRTKQSTCRPLAAMAAAALSEREAALRAELAEARSDLRVGLAEALVVLREERVRAQRELQHLRHLAGRATGTRLGEVALQTALWDLAEARDRLETALAGRASRRRARDSAP